MKTIVLLLILLLPDLFLGAEVYQIGTGTSTSQHPYIG